MKRLLLAALLCATAASAQGFGAARDVPTADVRRAIVIGINDYDDPKFPPLAYAAADAEALGDVLADPEYGGFASVTRVTSGDLSAGGVLAQLESWRASLGPDDFAFVYFSGHGTRWIDERNRSRVFLATKDTRRDEPLGTALPLDAVEELFRNLPAKRRTLVVDACLTGDGKVQAEDAEGAARAFVDEKAPFTERYSEKEARLFATTYGKPALEAKSLGHGVYTAHFIAALTEQFDAADIDEDLVVTVSEAHDYARDRTMDFSGEAQVPMAYYKVVGREELVLSGDPNSRKRVEAALISAYDSPQQGVVLLIDGQERGAFPRTVLVDPGAHVVEFRTQGGKTIDKGRFVFKKETAYDAPVIRDRLNGGRHLLFVGGGVRFLPGVAHITVGPDVGAGGLVSYGFRFPTRSNLGRRFGLLLDLGLHGFRPMAMDVDGGGGAPGRSPHTLVPTAGFGPFFRVDLGPAHLLVAPRFATSAILRVSDDFPDAEPPAGVDDNRFVNWWIGEVGLVLGVGVRPVSQVGIQLRYLPSVLNAPLKGGDEPDFDIAQTFALGVEIGL